MNISDIRITLFEEAQLKGTAKVTFDDCFVVRDLRVLLDSGSYSVAMPSHRLADGTIKDIAHPTNVETFKQIEDAVLKAYATHVKSVQPDADGASITRQMSMGGD